MAKLGKPEELLQRAVQAAVEAYAPYSHFAVGAAVELADGTIFTGANMENASYGLTVCAEVGALQKAANAGVLDRVVRIAIVGGLMKNPLDPKGAVVTPCGRCRQLIFEAAELAQTDIEVWCANLALTRPFKHWPIAKLLPEGFGPATLKVTDEWGKLARAFRKKMGARRSLTE
jgi:cytidine deaminase